MLYTLFILKNINFSVEYILCSTEEFVCEPFATKSTIMFLRNGEKCCVGEKERWCEQMLH